MITLERRNLKTFYSGNEEELNELRNSLSFFLKGAEYSQKYRDHLWDGYVKFYNERSRYFWFGMVDYVKNHLNKKGINYELIGYESRDVSWVKFSQPFLAENRDYQRNSILEFLRRTYGIIKVPTRGGKTFIASELIRLLHGRHKDNLNCVFIVDNVDLFKQAAQDISSVIGLPLSSIGQIQGDKFEPKNVSVAMIQTIQSALRGKDQKRTRAYEKWLKSINFVIIDEVQEFGSSKPRLGVIRSMKNLEYIACLSATPEKMGDEMSRRNIDSFSGGIVYEIEESELVKRKVLAENKVLLVENIENGYMGIKFKEQFDNYIVNNKVRNRKVLDIIEVVEKLDLKTLLIFQSVVHGNLISSSSGYRFLYGENDDKEREDHKNDFLSKKGGVLLVSDIWKKGITLPSVEILVNVDGGKEQSLVLQRRGRVLGVTDKKKKSLIIDFFDEFEPYFSNHTMERIEAYKTKMSEDNIDLIEYHNSELFKDYLERYLIDWFELNLQS